MAVTPCLAKFRFFFVFVFFLYNSLLFLMTDSICHSRLSQAYFWVLLYYTALKWSDFKLSPLRPSGFTNQTHVCAKLDENFFHICLCMFNYN